MKNLKCFIISCIVSVCFTTSFAQQLITGKEIILNSNESGEAKEYKAQQLVKLTPNFKYTPSAEKYFKGHIDKDMIVQTIYTGVDNNFYDRDINTSLPVGSSSANISVTELGAASYNLPLILPKGTAGMMPSLSINYNSHGGSDIMGVGWSITGLSAITRTGQNALDDFLTRPVTFTYNDRFLLDGQRLVQANYDSDFTNPSSYGKNGTVYYTAIQSFSKIISKESEGNSPKWFEVHSKNGLIYEYGKTQNSRFKPDGQNPLVWNLSRIYDQEGNYINFIYRELDHQLVIDKIVYTGNFQNGLSPYNEVKFYYDYREDKNVAFMKNSTIRSNVILREVEVKVQGAIFRRYNFDYAYIGHQSKLVSIKERGHDRKQYNTTIFKYQDHAIANRLTDDNSGAEYSITAKAYSNLPSFKTYIPGDFNGDGRTDVIALNETSDGFGLESYTLFLGNTHGQFEDAGTTSLPKILHNDINDDLTETAIPNQLSWSNNYNYSISDFNGDGKDDFVLSYRKLAEPEDDGNWIQKIENFLGAGYTYSEGVVMYDEALIFISNGRSFLNPRTTKTYKINTLPLFNTIKAKGDGTSQLLWHEAIDGEKSRFILYDYQRDEKKEIIGSNDFYFYNDDELFIIEDDGDVDAEIMIINDDGYKIFDVWEADDGEYYAEKVDSHDFPSTEYHSTIKTGDFNGDGLTDLLMRNDANGEWIIRHNFADKFWEPGTVNHLSSIPENVYTIDLNGDGKSEILSFTDLHEGTRNAFGTIIDVIFETKLAHQEIELKHTKINGWFNPTDRQLLLGDFNGDGKQDYFNIPYDHAASSNLSPEIFYFNPNNNPSLISQVTDGFNNDYDFRYATLSQDAWHNSYIQDFINNSDLSDAFQIEFQRPVPVVKQFKKPNNGGGADFIDYIYKGARFHRFGGFLGFKVFRELNYSQNTETYIRKQAYYGNNRAMAVTQKEVKRMDTDTQLSLVSYTYDDQTFAQDKHQAGLFHYVSRIANNDYVTGLNSTTDFTYDDHANITHTRTLFSNGEEQLFNAAYVEKGSWIKSSPSYVKSFFRKGSDEITRKSTFQYDDKGKVQQKTDFSEKSFNVRTTYNYDDYGNIVETSYSSSDPTVLAKTAKLNYDSKGRFIIKRIEPNGEYREIKFDVLTGQPIRKQNSDGTLFTEYEITSFGERSKIITPFGETAYAKEWHDTNPNGGVGFITKVSGDNIPDSEIVYGSLGQEISKKVNSFSGNIVSSNHYSVNNGRLESVTAPHLQSEPSITTNYSYDPINRLQAKSSPLGSINYSYDITGNGYRTTVTSDNGTTYQVVDNQGKITESGDEGGVMTYEYYPDGNLKKTFLNGTLLNEINYDEYGNQEQLIDPSFGSAQYTSNVVGNLIEQNDSRSNQFELSYDIDENLKEIKDISNSTAINYEYYSGGALQGLTKRVSGSNNVEDLFEYDEFGRVIELTENIEGETFTYQYEYDDFGNTTREVYPSGLELVNEYDQNGYKIRVSEANSEKVLWELGGMNSKGQPTSYTLGNGITTENEYDEYGYPKSSKAVGIIDLEYDFDQKTGNLLSRKDYLKGLEEHFEYDDLDRLTESKVGAEIPIYINYADNGNIIDKTDAGTYMYNNNNPNAVELVFQSFASEISENEQTIEYNSSNNPSLIEENGYSLSYTYGNDNQRKKAVLTNSGGQEVYTKYYSGSLEMIDKPGNNDIVVEYISCGDGVNVIHKVENNQSEFYYTYTDHLGSIVAITDETGTIIYEQNFDPWGRYRDPSTWEYTNNPNVPTWLRGYTGHEHLKEFDLINMNGRLYDPIVGRMLSPDNFVQSSGYSQNFNRYSYVFNNPLKYTDPSGEAVQMFPVVLGAINGGYQGYQIGKAKGAQGWELVGYTAAGAGIGATAGLVGAKVGGAAGGGVAGNFLGGVTSGAISGGGYAALAGENVAAGTSIGAISGGLGAGLGSFIGGRAGAITGGAVSASSSYLVRAQLYNEGVDTKAIIFATISGAGLSALSYEANLSIAYKDYKSSLGKDAFLSRQGFRKVSTALQRTNAWGVEFGWFETHNGDVVGMRTNFSRNQVYIDLTEAPYDAKFLSHTHPEGRTFGPTDIYNNASETNYDNVAFKVYTEDNVFVMSKTEALNLKPYMLNFGTEEYYRYEKVFTSDPSTKTMYYNFIKGYNVSNGIPHNISFISHQTFIYGY